MSEREILDQKVYDMIVFLIETDPEIHSQIVHALRFASMEIANKNKGSNLGYYVYRKTKKDVVEFKRICPYEALVDIKVIEFAVKYEILLYQEFDGDIEHLKRYLKICNEIINGGY